MFSLSLNKVAMNKEWLRPPAGASVSLAPASFFSGYVTDAIFKCIYNTIHKIPVTQFA